MNFLFIPSLLIDIRPSLLSLGNHVISISLINTWEATSHLIMTTHTLQTLQLGSCVKLAAFDISVTSLVYAKNLLVGWSSGAAALCTEEVKAHLGLGLHTSG